MFRALICPSSGICDYVVELPHWLISFSVSCVLELGCGSARVVSGLPAALSLDLSSNYTISTVFWRVWGVVGLDLLFIIVGGITLGFIKLPLNHPLH